jgi:hypothetical protein
MKLAHRSEPDHQKRYKVIRKTGNTRKVHNTLENVTNKTARKLVPTSAATAALDTEEVSQRPKKLGVKNSSTFVSPLRCC